MTPHHSKSIAKDDPLKSCERWLAEWVIAESLCPFAQRPYQRNQIRFCTQVGTNLEQLTELLLRELKTLDDDRGIETTVIVITDALQCFYAYLDYVEVCNAILEHMNYVGVYQIASFHPKYCFDGVGEEDPSNYTNRSPFPLLHILREESLTSAIDAHPEIDAVPERNIAHLRKMGLEHILTRLSGLGCGSP